jgi:xylulose-5-phosphate/fructose-6-phosphate phosphoketolase
VALTTAQLDAYVRATNYLTVAQIYLKDNQLLERPLVADDVKPRLLGHWGTCPGINLTYAHLNRLIAKEQASLLFVLGPGHGFPALQANLFLEGSLGAYYPQATHTAEGVAYLARSFSWPGGFPSHTNPGTPGAILEGGELGYSLATAYGAALDNPDLIVACLIGDGEAETGPLAGSWPLVRYVDPGTNGAVLPIVHLNGAKISQPTTFARMGEDDLLAYFRGVGYEPYIVEGDDLGIHERLGSALDGAYARIRELQAAARQHPTGGPWRMPVILLKTPKGWTGPKRLDGKQIEGTFRAHQVVAPNAKTVPAELEALEAWLRSYRFDELFSDGAGFTDEVQAVIPSEHLQMGRNRHAFGGPEISTPLTLPKTRSFTEEVASPGADHSSAMRLAGAYLAESFRCNEKEKNLRFFSPDETTSNKLDAIFDVTARAYAMGEPRPEDDHLTPNGRSLELLSEHALQGVAQGYALTGRHAVFTSYEAFAPIVASMVDQYVKFLKVARDTRWRGGVPSLTYILTSSGWRQEHNGFSHQNPGFIDDLLQRHTPTVKVYLPPDGNTAVAALAECLNAKNGVNVIVAGKTDEPRWLSPELAERALRENLSTWEFASDENPDLVFLGIGDYMVKESLAAIQLLRSTLPGVRLRFTNLIELAALSRRDGEKHALDLMTHLTPDKPVVVNFHGYPETIKQLLFDHVQNPRRFTVRGYVEQGSTTTPFDMQVRNGTSRYHLAIAAAEQLKSRGTISGDAAERAIARFEATLAKHATYIVETGVDLPEVEEWSWQPR